VEFPTRLHFNDRLLALTANVRHGGVNGSGKHSSLLRYGKITDVKSFVAEASDVEKVEKNQP
jgi:hypothetical protein